jgi:hypothetical protein
MTEDDARSIVAVLNAAYPKAALEPETVDLYTAQFARLGSVSAATETIQQLIDSSSEFPTLAEFRKLYLSTLKREQEEAVRERGLAEGPGAPPPPEWHAMMKRINRGELVRDL